MLIIVALRGIFLIDFYPLLKGIPASFHVFVHVPREPRILFIRSILNNLDFL